MDLNLWGYFSYNLELGGFLNSNNISAIDQYYLNTNQSRVVLDKDYLKSFKLIPYYTSITQNKFANIFFEYHLEGKLMDNLPVLKNWGIKSVIGLNRSQFSSEHSYSELSFGIENLGINGIPIFRLDYVWSFENTSLLRNGLVLHVSNTFN